MLVLQMTLNSKTPSITNEVQFTPNDYRYIPGCFVGQRLVWAAAYVLNAKGTTTPPGQPGIILDFSIK